MTHIYLYIVILDLTDLRVSRSLRLLANNHIPTVNPLEQRRKCGFTLNCTLVDRSTSITLFCTDTGAKSVIAYSLVINLGTHN